MSDDDGLGPLLLPDEAAKMMRVSVHTLARWVKAGQMRAVVLPSGTRRYRESDVRAWLRGEALRRDHD